MSNEDRGLAQRGRLIYGIAVFCGAVLVFQVQPIAGRFLLPAFGGGAAVWTASMFFFQCALLAGYAYAHALINWAPPKRQAAIHAALLIASVLFLPLGFSGESMTASPGLAIWLALSLSIGVPFVVLAGTAPLMQRWYASSEAPREPYRLYALSNTGALLALLSYPFLVEPRVALDAQAFAWSGGYGLFLVTSLAACLRLRRHDRAANTEFGDAEAARMPASDSAAVLVLAACGVVLLLAVTNQVTQNVAPIPFLWVLPLVIYLLTWIATFASDRFYDRSTWGSLFVIAASCMILLEYFGGSFGIVPVIIAYLAVLACVCVVCHGEVYRLRPEPAGLAGYYLLIAAGGALGGALVSIVAPLVFDRYWEGLAGVYIVYLVFGALVLRDYRRDLRRGTSQSPQAAAALPMERWARRLFVAGWATGILLFPAVIASVHSLLPQNDIVSQRNFYGVLNVRDDRDTNPPRRQLVDGTTIHGFQLLAEGRRSEPTSYYARNTGIGRLLETFTRDGEPLRMGMIGLGVGTLAAYGQPGDTIRFYELNPAVIDVAQRHFTFLENSAANIDIVAGDARVSLERELRNNGSRGYDLLVVDAFTSGAIPVHLLTREALQLYLSHLADDGVLAFHVTNNYLELAPVLAKAAAVLDLRALLVTSRRATGISDPADWVLLHAAGASSPVSIGPGARYLEAPPGQRLWTDDYSDLLGTLRP